jgi:hypothetical protein
MTKIAEAVLKVMSQVGYVQKKGVNSFQNYKYASIEGILEKIQPALVDCGLVIVQSEISHEIVAEGNLMEAVYEFTLHHSSGETSAAIRQTGLSSLRNSKGGYDDKALNKCHTTARKYFILGLFQIPTGLADDADAEEDKPAVTPPPRKAAGDSNKAKAETFVDTAITAIGTLTDEAGLVAWLEKNSGPLARLREAYPELARQVEGARDGQRASFGGGK